jgi:uncharacterized protein (TIGR02597 family)
MQKPQELSYKKRGFYLLDLSRPNTLVSIQKGLMRRYIPLLATLAAAVIFSSVTSAVTITTTDPVGFTTTSLPAASDTLLSIPFTRPPEFIGAISAASGNTITVAGTPWTASQFVYVAGTQPKSYYVLIGGGGSPNPKEGHTYFINGNGSNTLTVITTPTNDLAGITANTQIVIIPYWTLATVFPAGDANVSFTPTTSTSSYKTQIQIPNDSAASITYSPVYFFSNNVDGTPSNVGWRIVGNNTTDHGDDPLSPDSFFVVRNQNGAPTLPLTTLGAVLLKKLSAPLMTETSGTHDNAVSMLRPLDVALDATGLNPTDGSFVAGNPGVGDQLLLFNNAQIAFNKAPSLTYYYNTVASHPAWRLTGDTTLSDRGADVIPSGSAIVLRKAATGGGQSVFWTNSFPVTAISAVSRKSHNGVPGSPFDIPLPLTGTPGVECRNTGGDYQVIFTFPTAVTFNNPNTANSASITSGAGIVASTSGSGTTAVTVNLTGVTDVQRITLTLLGVNDGTNTNDVAVRMGVLIGDVNASRVVNTGDTNLCKAQALQTVTTANFRNDINASGVINTGDVNLIKQNALHQLPPP